MSNNNDQPQQPQLALPAPGDPPHEPSTRSLNVVEGTTIQMDELGPIIVNSDGTLSRISNWHEMTPPEQERTVRLIAKRRNQERMKALQKKEDEEQAAKE
ncbi:hypothetical protein FFLO_01422 [Filobasidium floriforme]|uniref:Uncharacterized protein n=1 Tax=Filobasidium floriforme TaxID=5210 RepID=A0A8K0JPJ5_9TREE|nr:hypothetical protein FFLO_01422 [Filobasidium floriforme]